MPPSRLIRLSFLAPPDRPRTKATPRSQGALNLRRAPLLSELLKLRLAVKRGHTTQIVKGRALPAGGTMSERAVIRTDPTVKDALRIETHGSDHVPETETEQRERETIVFRRGAEGRWLAVLEHLSPAP
jgi:hypothetical protein